MLDSLSADCAIQPLREVPAGDLLLRTTRNRQMELAVRVGEQQSSGVPVIVLKEATRPCDLPHADWWHSDEEVISLGDDWVLKPLEGARADRSFWQDGVLVRDSEGMKLRLWLGPDDLAPVATYFDLTKRCLTARHDRAADCFSAWGIWMRSVAASNVGQKPLFVYGCHSESEALAA